MNIRVIKILVEGFKIGQTFYTLPKCLKFSDKYIYICNLSIKSAFTWKKMTLIKLMYI